MKLDASLVRHYRGDYANHLHDHAQVLVGLVGSLQLEVNGHAAFVDPSCGLVLPAGCRHAYRAEGAASVLVLDCPADKATARFRRFAMDHRWARSVARLSPGLLLNHLEAAPTLNLRRRLDLDSLTQLIDAHLSRGWTVAMLAASCHLSPQRFRARFAELTGASPLAYVRARRLNEAERLLKLGWLLESVAIHVGYASASALSFALRRDRLTGTRELQRSMARRQGSERAFLES